MDAQRHAAVSQTYRFMKRRALFGSGRKAKKYFEEGLEVLMPKSVALVDIESHDLQAPVQETRCIRRELRQHDRLRHTCLSSC